MEASKYNSKPFMMRQLPKPEYYLLRDLTKAFGLDDPSELVSALLVYFFENCQRGSEEPLTWMVRIINDIRTIPDKDRKYFVNIHK